MNQLVNGLAFAVCVIFLPAITLGTIRKAKALIQGRVGAPVLQPLFDILKLFKKGQTISSTTSWIFLVSSALNFSATIAVASFVPWLSFKPAIPGDDLFFLLYLLALVRFFTILSSLDSGSPFGAFGGSREAYLSMLVEPAMFISLAALGLVAGSSSLGTIFAFAQPCTAYDVPVWLAAATSLFLASIVDLSRMPIDDPTTHLELTMVHEAMIIENSGSNLALIEFAHALKLTVLYGLISQCLLHAATYVVVLSETLSFVLSIALIVGLALFTAAIESVAVKLRWRATPEFIAYALTMSLFATGAALIGGMYASHGL